MKFNISKRVLRNLIRKTSLSMLCTLFLLQQTMLIPVLAETTNITGYANNITSGGKTYNIDAATKSGSTGFRSYSNFSVGAGDVVNMNFNSSTLGSYNKFVNFVSNQISINGLLNSVRGDSFFNGGHVVFVSPNGMIIGSKGVVNVGSLTVFTPSQSKFNSIQSALSEDLSSLESGNQGVITINGKIFARNGVNLYGKNITVDGGAIIAGIDPTIANYNQTLTSNTGASNFADSEYLFNSLVKNNVVQGSAFASENGKIVIKAQDSSNIKFSSQSLSDFEVDLSGVADSITKATSSSSVTITDAVLAASSMDISAISDSTYDVEAALVPGILTDIVLNIDKVLDGTYSGWLGAKSTANVSITNSQLASSSDISISTSASSTLSIPTAVGVDPASQQYIYSIGTSTESKINVEKSKIKSTDGDVSILASSTNEEEASFKATNNSTDIETQIDENTSLGSVDPDAKIILVSSALNATTSVIIDKDSTVESKNVAVGAVNASENSVTVEASTEIGEEEAAGSGSTGSTGSSGGSTKAYATVVSLAGILNRTNVNTTSEVNGTVNAADSTGAKGNVDVVAQNLCLTTNTATATSTGKAKTTKNKASTTSTGVLGKITSKINNLTGKNTTTTAQSSEAIGGSAVINLSNLNATAKIGKTAKITADKLNIKANTVDLTINNTTATVSNAKYAPAVAIIINTQNDSTTAKVEDGDSSGAAVINLDDSLNISATTQMPLNTAALSQYVETFQNITAPFTNASDFWNSSFLSNVVNYAQDLYEAYGDFNPADFSALQVVPGFFNNYAESNTDGTSLAIGGSVIYSDVNNSTKAYLGNYTTLNAEGDIVVNATNSIVYNSLAGVLGDLIQMTKKQSGVSATGIGGSLVLSFNDHDAEASIGNNVKINAEKTSSASDISLNAATNQFYLTIAAGGSQGSSTAIEGSVAVIEVDGTTKTSIGNNDTIKANSLTLNAGSGSINYASQDTVLGIGYQLSGMDDDTGFIDMEDTASAISDKTQMVTITGALAKQTSGSTTTASGTAVGASVNVAVTDRDVVSSIGNNSTITLTKGLSVLANTDTGLYDIAIAGAFAGGVSTKKTTTGTGTTSGTTGGQATSNQGGWIDKVTSILSSITGKTGSSSTSSAASTSTSTVNSRTNSGTAASSLSTSTTSNGTSTTSGSSTVASSLSNASNLNSTSTNSTTATNQLNLAAAGSINAVVTDNNVSASIGNSKITIGGIAKVSATQSNSMVNVSTGLAKASGVGAGAALNLSLNLNSTNANIGNSTSDPTDTTDYAEISTGNNAISINAQDITKAVNVAVGVGAATSSTNNKSSTSAAIGGSFNASVLANSVNSYIGKNAKISNASTVGTSANNTTSLINIAGGIAANTTGSSSTSIGAGIAANINVFAQDTEAGVMDGASISSSDALTVDADNKDNVVSIGVAGTVITGGNSAYTFTGALGTDVLVNTTSAYINNSTVTSKGVSVTADNNIGNYNLAGAASFSSSQSSYSVGTGAVVEVIANNTKSRITGSTITSTGKVDVKATQNEILKFLAVNGAISNSGSGFVAGLNGIINVLVSTVDSYISNSDIKNATDTNVISNYYSDIEGITAVGAISTGTSVASLNLIANVVSNSVLSRIENSDLNATGKLTVKSYAEEYINVIPVAFSVSVSSGFSVAANIAANIIVNTTSATISGSKTTTGSVSSTGCVNVSAADNTTVKVRGGTVSLSGDSAAIGGSILLDVLVKNVNASIGDSTTVTSSGDIDVSASAINLFGPKDTVDPASISSVISSLDKVASIGDWGMTYDLAGGNSAAVSGSVIVKAVCNNVNASIGSKSKVTGKSIDVLADNETYIRAIVGNITASGTAAIGGSFFINTLVGLTNASIGSGSMITTTGTPSTSDTTAGDVNVKATSIEDVRTVMVTGGGSGTVAVNGSLNVNTIVNITKAVVDNATIDAKGDLSVIADESNNISSLNLSVSGSGTVSVGVIGYVNTFADVIESSIKNSTSTKAGGNILVDANGSDSFGATVAVVSAAGTTGIAGLVLFNTIASVMNSYISNSTVTSTGGNVTVSSDYDYNKTKYGSDDISAYLTTLSSGSDNYGSDDLIGNYIPIVTALNVTGSAYASVGVTAITNTIVSSVNAYVSDSTVSSSTGLSIKANTDLVAYDAMASFAVAGVGAAVTVNGITNTLVNTTSAYLDKSTVTKGDVDVEATQNANLNSIIVGASVVGVGGAVSGLFSTKVIASTISSRITDSLIQDSNNVKVKSVSNNKINNFSVAGAGSGIGGTVTGVTSTNVLAGKTEAYISGTNTDGVIISKGTVSVEADNYLKTFDLITAATVSGVGADVGINIATNVIVNSLNSYINNAKLANNVSTSVKTISDIDLYDIVANCGVNLVGASVGGLILSNIVDNSINSYITDSTITGGTVSVTASQDTNLSGGATSINAGGLSVAANVHAVTNVFQDSVNAYIQDSTLSSNTSVTVTGTSGETINFATLSGSAAGLGGIAGSVLTNVIGNDLNSYISGGSISTSGAIAVSANQTITMNNLSGGVSIGAAGVGARSIVNVLTNTAKAYMDDTAVSNSSSIIVSATSTENIINNNYVASGGGVSAGVGVLVNVIENTTQAYINAKSDTVKTGTLKVTANDNLTLSNIAGVASIAAAYSGAMSINVNIINNAVMAELLSSSSGSVNATTVDVTSDSTMNLDIATASAAAGITGLGLAGTIAVTSIGDRVASSDSDYNSYIKSSSATATDKAEANSSNSTAKSKLTVTANGTTYDYSSSGSTVNLDATSSTAKAGTVANINGNVTSTNAVNVKATNTVKGIGDDIFNVTNVAAAAGTVAAGASILVTDMKYKTTAEISGGTVKSTSGKNITVKATNTVKAETNAASAAVGALAVGGNVALFKNDATTTALISGSTVQTTGTVNVIANSTDSILTRAISGSAGLGAANFVVALSKTTNDTTANVKGSTINGGSSTTKSGDVNVKAKNTSSLISEMESGTIGGYTLSALFNYAQSNSITSALVSNSSNIYADDFNLVSSTGGITAESIMYVGSLTYAGISAEAAGADVNAEFDAGINGTVKADNDINIKAGVKCTGEPESTDESVTSAAGEITAKVSSVKVNISAVSGSTTNQKATADAKTNIIVDSGSTVTAGDEINIYSTLNRNAYTGQTSGTISGITIGVFTLDAETGGSSTINIGGSLVADTIDVDVKDKNTANAKMLSASLTLASGSATYLKSVIDSDVKITLASTGSLNADSIDVNSASTRTATISNADVGASLAHLSYTNMTATSSGETRIDLSGNVKAENQTSAANSLNAVISDTSNAYNNSVSYGLSFLSGNSLQIKSEANTDSYLTLGGNINAKTILGKTIINKEAIANSVSSSISLGSLSYFNLDSVIGGTSNTYAKGNITTNSLTLTSILNNTVKTNITSNSRGLIALASGHAKNTTNTTNYIYFSNGTSGNANITSNATDVAGTGLISASAATNNNVYMTGNTDTAGFIAVSGGSFENSITSNTGIKASGDSSSKILTIEAADIALSATNTTIAPVGLHFDDGSGGFVTDSGGKISTTISQTNDVKFDDYVKVYGSNTLAISMNNNSNFNQYVSSSSSGAGCYNSAKSYLTVYNYNNLTIDENTDNTNYYVKGGKVTIAEDFNNSLVSQATIEASHFAGDPTVKSYVTLGNYNNNAINSYLGADNLLTMKLMNSSSNVITQYAYARVKAAVATSSRDGGINYVASNDINISSTGKLASAKDVNIYYSNGKESLSSKIAYKHTHYALFGIPITKSGSHSNVSASRPKTLELNGKIEAGEGANKKLTIDSNGNVTENEGDISFTKSETTDDSGDSATAQERITELNELIVELSDQKSVLESDKANNAEKITELESQVSELKAELMEYKLQLATLNYITDNSLDSMALSSVKSDLSGLLETNIGDAYKNLSGSDKTYVITYILSNLVKENSDGTYTQVSISSTEGQNVISTAIDYVKQNNTSDTIVSTAQSNLTTALTSFSSALQTTNTTLTTVDPNGSSVSNNVNVYTYTKVTGQKTQYVYKDGSGNEIVLDTKLSDDQAKAGGYSFQNNKTVDVYTTYTVYDDSVAIGDSQYTFNNISTLKLVLNTIESSRQSLYNKANLSLSSYNTEQVTLNGQISDLEGKISIYNSEMTDIQNNGLGYGITNYTNGSYTFDDMKLSSGGITIKGVSSVTGSGSFVVNAADLLINNNSNYNLIFKDISIGSGNAGVWVNGISYSKAGYTGLGSTQVVVNGSPTNCGQITINNWFDSSDPTLADGVSGSNLVFLGDLQNSIGGVNLYNESENIIIKNSVIAQAVNIIAPQGDVTINAPKTTFDLNSSSTIIAGNDVTINTGSTGTIKLNGSIIAGNSTRSLTLTDSMLSGATETEKVNGITYKVINVKLTSKSAYLNSSNNIKALYNPSTNEILLFDTTASGGSVLLTGKTISGSGKVSYSSNYGTIAIDNQTTAKLVVNDIKNNYYAGTISNIPSAVTKVKNGVASATTNINSIGAIDVAGIVSSGNYGSGSLGSGVLTISSDGSTTVDNHTASSVDPAQVETIDTTGTVNIVGKNGVSINGNITNRNGDTTVSNSGLGSLSVTKTGVIENSSGDISIISASTGGINIAGTINNNVSGNTSIKNSNTGSTGIAVSGNVTNNSGALTISNSGTSGIEISGSTTNNTGNTSVTNEIGSAGGINVDGSVSNTAGKTAITNNGFGGITISGSVNNSAGSTNKGLDIVNAVDTGIRITSTGNVTNNDGNTRVTNNGTGGITVSQGGRIYNESGALALKNNGFGNIAIAGRLTNKFGNLSVLNTNTAASKIVISGSTSTTVGDTIISNAGTGGIIISGNTTNNTGNTSITNEAGSAGGIAVSGKVENTSGKIAITNNGAGGITVSGLVTNSNDDINIVNATDTGITVTSSGIVANNGNGNTNVTNNGTGGITVAQGGSISNDTGNLTLTNTGLGNIVIAGSLTNAFGNLGVLNVNAQESGINISGTTVNTSGNTTISSKGTNGIIISGSTSNTKGNTEIANELASEGGINISGAVKNNGVGDISVTNNGKDGITVTLTGNVNNNVGDLTITNTGLGNIAIAGSVENVNGNLGISNINTQESGIYISGTAANNSGNTNISSKGKNGIFISGSTKNTVGNTSITNEAGSAGGINISGSVINTLGKTIITNNGTGGITVSGIVSNSAGNNDKDIEITNATDAGITVTGTGSVINKGNGNTKVTNNGAGGITVANGGSVSNDKGDLTLTNIGVGDVSIAGSLSNTTGTLSVLNTNTQTSGISISGSATNDRGSLIVTNEGSNGIVISGTTTNNLNGSATGNTEITNNNTEESGITVTSSGIITNNKGLLKISNKGKKGILIEGNTINTRGNTEVTNKNTSATAGIILESTGRIANTNGDIVTDNVGGKGTTVKGLITTLNNGSITINNINSNVVVGDDSSLNNDFYITANNGDITINNSNGNVLNSGVDKTMVKTNENLLISVIDGNIGSTIYTNPSNPGLGIEAKTRDARESFNINVGGTVTAKALNKNNTNDTLINLTSKNSDMNLNQIKADGNILLTAIDWADSTNDSGYSILNRAADGVANIEGKNISLISSKNTGEKAKWLTFNQTSNLASKKATTNNAWLSAESEKDIYIKSLSDDYSTNLWEMVAKTGNLGLELSGNTIVREITAGGNLQMINKGANLTIYDLGKLSHMLKTEDDILYPHDHIAIGNVVPTSLTLEVLDINSKTRVNPSMANSILNVYNAYVKGLSNGSSSQAADVVLRADNVIANGYGAVSSPVSTKDYSYGYNAAAGRSYTDNPLDPSTKLLYAKGFSSVGKGQPLTFDIRGVSPDLVAAIGRNIRERNYYVQSIPKTISAFTNQNVKPGIDYKVKNVALSVNSSNAVKTEDRGVTINHLYANNAYIDTKNTNLVIKDAIINNYAEFRNGNDSDVYKWLTVVDNDYRRLISFSYGLPVTLQLYTALTGSFNLSMGRIIVLDTVAPAVYYDPDENANLFHTENSFYRLTYKDDKIQKTTATPAFKDIDKATYKPVQRTALRFTVSDNDVEFISSNNGVVNIVDISRTGLLIKQDGTLKVGDKFTVSLKLDNTIANVDVQVVRVNNFTKQAGLRFINLDKSTENMILYTNLMRISQKNKAKDIASVK